MLPSQIGMITKLSKLQRDMLIDHVDRLIPFSDDPAIIATRESLVVRELIYYEPIVRTRLGRPDGTKLTDPFGREAVCLILGWYHDAITRVRNRLRDRSHESNESALLRTLADSAEHWVDDQPTDNKNGRRKLVL